MIQPVRSLIFHQIFYSTKAFAGIEIEEVLESAESLEDSDAAIEIEEVVTLSPSKVPTANIEAPPSWVKDLNSFVHWTHRGLLKKDTFSLGPIRNPINPKTYVLSKYESKNFSETVDGPIVRSLGPTAVCVKCFRWLLTDEFDDLTGVCVFCKEKK
jgi:hypothetical protein